MISNNITLYQWIVKVTLLKQSMSTFPLSYQGLSMPEALPIGSTYDDILTYTKTIKINHPCQANIPIHGWYGWLYRQKNSLLVTPLPNTPLLSKTWLFRAQADPFDKYSTSLGEHTQLDKKTRLLNDFYRDVMSNIPPAVSCQLILIHSIHVWYIYPLLP